MRYMLIKTNEGVNLVHGEAVKENDLWLIQEEDCEEYLVGEEQILLWDVPPHHPSRCDKAKWDQMRQGYAEQDKPRGGGEDVFPEVRRLFSKLTPFFEEVIESEETKKRLLKLTSKIEALIDQREQYGIDKYGQSLKTFDGRDNLKDVTDEVLDAMVYLTKAFMEKDARIKEFVCIFIILDAYKSMILNLEDKNDQDV